MTPDDDITDRLPRHLAPWAAAVAPRSEATDGGWNRTNGRPLTRSAVVILRPNDQGPLVQERRHLLPFCRHLYGRQWRWDRRFPGADAAARLSARAGHHCNLADAVPMLARPRRRLRRLRLLRRQ